MIGFSITFQGEWCKREVRYNVLRWGTVFVCLCDSYSWPISWQDRWTGSGHPTDEEDWKHLNYLSACSKTNHPCPRALEGVMTSLRISCGPAPFEHFWWRCTYLFFPANLEAPHLGCICFSNRRTCYRALNKYLLSACFGCKVSVWRFLCCVFYGSQTWGRFCSRECEIDIHKGRSMADEPQRGGGEGQQKSAVSWGTARAKRQRYPASANVDTCDYGFSISGSFQFSK